jgi:hypothetical protein
MNNYKLILTICIFIFCKSQNIKNKYLPSCKTCKYYKPNPLHFDFTSDLNKCEKFGEKNIISDKIIFDRAIDCRRNNEKCGIFGKEWEKEPNIFLKSFLFNYCKFMIIWFLTIFINYISSNYFK